MPPATRLLAIELQDRVRAWRPSASGAQATAPAAAAAAAGADVDAWPASLEEGGGGEAAMVRVWELCSRSAPDALCTTPSKRARNESARPGEFCVL